MTKPPRLPQPCTLDEAAQWLSAECAQTWTARSVLSRFTEWEGDSAQSWRAFAPPTLMVMIDAGVELLDCVNEFRPISFSNPQSMEVTVPVDQFIADMLAVGKAKPQGLRHPFNDRRYKITEAVAMDAIRIPAEWVHLLKPAAQPEGAKVGAGGTARPKKQHVFQDELLIKTLEELGFKPLELIKAKPGCRDGGPRKAAYTKLKTDHKWTESVMRHAWERASKAKRIAYAPPPPKWLYPE